MSIRDSLVKSLNADLANVVSDAVRAASIAKRDVVLQDVVVQCMNHPLNKSLITEAQNKLALQLLTKLIPSSAESDATFLTQIVDACRAAVSRLGGDRVTPTGLLVGLLLIKSGAPSILDIRNCLICAGITVEQLIKPGAVPTGNSSFVFKPLKYGTDITSIVESGRWQKCPLVGNEMLKILTDRILPRLAHRSVCLIGEAGVGKTAIVRGLAWHMKMASPFVRKKMRQCRIIALTRADILAGTGVQGSLEQRLKNMLEFFTTNRDIIPFFDEVHTLFDSRDEEGVKVVNLLKPAMADGSFRCIAATTDREYETHIMPDPPLDSRFSPPVLVPEPGSETTIATITNALEQVTPDDAKDLGVSLHVNVIPKIVELTQRYQKSERQPRKSFFFLQQAFEQKCHRIETVDDEPRQIDVPFILDVAGKCYGLNIDRERPDFWPSVLDDLGRTAILNNHRAAIALCAFLQRRYEGLAVNHDRQTPIGRILVLGDATTACLIRDVLQSRLYGDPSGHYTEDMNRFATKDSRMLLVGAPPGHIGFESTRTLFSKLRTRPHGGVLLLTNFDRTHHSLEPDIAAILSGSAKDSGSNNIDFSSWLVLMCTSLDGLRNRELDLEGYRQLLRNDSSIWTGDIVKKVDLVIDVPEAAESSSASESLSELLAAWNAVAISYPPELDRLEFQEGLIQTSKNLSIPVSAVVDSFLQNHFETQLKETQLKKQI